MDTQLADAVEEFRRYKRLADRAMQPLEDEAFFRRPDEQAKSIAIIVKHVGGNLLSRWTDFLTTDGDKPNRDRDSEFVIGPSDTRAKLMERWEAGWETLFKTLGQLRDSDLSTTITIRGEPLRANQALVRSLAHSAYHAGQIMYLCRLWQPDSAWQTIAPGQSNSYKPVPRPS